MKQSSRRLIIDSDSFAYTIGHKVMRPVDFGDGNITATFSLADVRSAIDSIFADLFEELQTTECVLCLSDPEPKADWRKKIYPGYKNNRKPGQRPMAYAAVRDDLSRRWQTQQHANMEADDICGVLATSPSRYAEQILVSPDKDLLTIPGHLYNPTHKTLEYITVDQANLNHMTQTLVGDRADCFPGLPGCGPKKAAKILAGCQDIQAAWPKVVKAFEAAGLTEADALIQAQLAGILRYGQYEPDTGAVIPWEPPV